MLGLVRSSHALDCSMRLARLKPCANDWELLRKQTSIAVGLRVSSEMPNISRDGSFESSHARSTLMKPKHSACERMSRP